MRAATSQPRCSDISVKLLKYRVEFIVLANPQNGQDLTSRLLYRDAGILVLDKPAGIAVHRAPGAGQTLEASLDSLRFGLKWLPGLAHRLDRDTSGCLVLGRHPQALRRLNELFAAGAVQKTYWAICEGVPRERAGVVDLPLLKVHRGKHWRILGDAAGQSATTEWRVLGTGDGRSWLELRPHEGRMHQIRVHCASLLCPVIGDPLYGIAGRPGERLHLLARQIGFQFDRKKHVEAIAPPAPHMLPALVACGYQASQSAESDRAQTGGN